MHHVCGNELDAEEEDDRTPVLSRENSDVKTQFPNRYQWRSHISTSMIDKLGADIHNHNEPQSPDLLASGADIRILRLRPGSSSPCASPNLSITSSTGDRFCNLILKTTSSKITPNVISNVDELRVSDFIIRSSVTKKNDKYGTIEELYTPIAMSEHSSRKPSIVSVKSESRQVNGRKSSVASIESGVGQTTTPNLRRTTLITKSETLGLAPSSTTLGTNKTPAVATVYNEKSALSRRTTNNSNDLKSSSTPYRVQFLKNNNIINQTTLSASNLAPKLKRTNSSSMNACIAAAKVQQRQYNTTISQRDLAESNFTSVKNTSRSNVKNNGNLTTRVSTNNSAVAWRNGSAFGAGVSTDENNLGAAKITRRQSDRRNSVTTIPSTTSAAAGVLSRNIPGAASHRKSVGAAESALRTFPVRQPGQRPWRPPKRTAEEITLDKTLEVNWSVSSIRSVFQNNKDDKPAAIDTVYAKFDVIPKTSTNS